MILIVFLIRYCNCNVTINIPKFSDSVTVTKKYEKRVVNLIEYLCGKTSMGSAAFHMHKPTKIPFVLSHVCIKIIQFP